jgi:peptide/nickel transport system permease protein
MSDSRGWYKAPAGARAGRPRLWRFLLGRSVSLLVLLFLVSVVTFLLFFAGPSDPARAMCGKSCTPERIEKTRIGLGLDRPVVVQYLDYMKGVMVGRDIGPPSSRDHCGWPCFGRSFVNNQWVWTKIRQAFPYTFVIAIGAGVLWLFVGVSVGLIAGLRKGSWVDKVAVAMSSVAMAMPMPVIGLTLIWLLRYQFGWVPAFDPTVVWPWNRGGPLGWLGNFSLVWVTLALVYSAAYVRLARATTVDTMGEDYIRTARAKGLRNSTVVFRHGLRPSMTPIVTMFGMDLAGLIGGAVIAETIFDINGLGKMTVTAEGDGDLPVLMAVTLIAAFFIITANVVVDILYAVIDPRVELS